MPALPAMVALALLETTMMTMMTETMTSEPAPIAPKPMVVMPDMFRIDNLLPAPQRALVYDFLNAGGWKFGWKSSARTDTYSFWHRHFAGHHNGRGQKKYDCAEELRKTPMIFAFWQYLADNLFKDH